LYKKMLKEYLIHEQNSVFMGDLPEAEWVKLQSAISREISPEDSVLTLVCRNRHNVEVRRLAKDAAGGQMRQEKNRWHGEDWAIL